MTTMTDVKVLAGFFSGEGCVTSSTNGRGSYFLKITLGQKDENAIRWVQDRFGGSIRERPSLPGFWNWYTTGARAGKILEIIKPYLLVKQDQAALGIELAHRPPKHRQEWIHYRLKMLKHQPGGVNYFPTLSSLWRDTISEMWYGTIDNGGLSVVGSADTIRYDNLLACESMEFDLDMGRDLWLNKQRWTRLVRQYLDPKEVERFVDHATLLARGEGAKGACTSMFCSDVARESKKHRWGNCMLAFVYHGDARRGTPTISMHSRVSYIAYIGGLDLALARVLAGYIGEEIGVAAEDFRFRWHVDALQFHGFKSIPMLFKHDFIEDLQHPELAQMYPTQKLVGKWFSQIVDFEQRGIHDNKYGPLKRVMRRYREYVAEDYLPSVGVEDLDFSPIGL